VLELIEVAAPFVRNGPGIVEVGFVEFFYVRGITAKQV